MKRLFFLPIFILFFSGCSGILVAENTPLSLEGQIPQICSIDSYTIEQPGTVYSFSNDETTILSVGNSAGMFTIDQFDLKTSNLVNITTSDTPILDIQSAEQGLFYTKYSASDSKNIQIVWSSSDKLVERTISDPQDNPQGAISVYGEDNIVYINNGNEFVFADSLGAKEKYNLKTSIIAKKIVWNPETESGFMIAQKENEEPYELYKINLDKNEINYDIIATNIIDMSYDKKSGAVAYAVQENDKASIYLLSKEAKEANKLLATESLTQIVLDQANNSIYFSKSSSNDIQKTIWIFKSDTKKTFQISSPIRLVSNILIQGNSETLYFSENQLTYSANGVITQPYPYITKLVFSIPEGS